MLRTELWSIYKLFTKGNNDIKYQSTKVVIIDEINKQIAKKIIKRFKNKMSCNVCNKLFKNNNYGCELCHKKVCMNCYISYEERVICKTCYTTKKDICYCDYTFDGLNKKIECKLSYKCHTCDIDDIYFHTNDISEYMHHLTTHKTYCNGCGRKDDFCRCGSFNAFSYPDEGYSDY